MLATFSVTNLNDAGQGSLRQAILDANLEAGSDVVAFDASLSGTIRLSSELELTEALTMEGPGARFLTIDAEGQSRVLNITATSGDFTVNGLTLTGGKTVGDNAYFGYDASYSGGAIRSATSGDLRLNQITITGNGTEGRLAVGGGVFALGGVILERTTISDNGTMGRFADGGGVFSVGPVALTESTVSGNRTTGLDGDGGGIYATAGVTLIRSTVTDNLASGLGSAGGGIVSYGASDITGSIVAGNSAMDGGSDLVMDEVSVNFSLVGDNLGTLLVESQSADVQGNLIGSSAGVGVINPRLAPLSDFGGPTPTHLPLVGSPAINAGDPAFQAGVDGIPEFDQRGDDYSRVRDNRIDMGAVEAFRWHNTALPNDVNGDGQVGPLDALLVINELNDREFSSPEDGRLNEIAAPPPFLDVNDDSFVSPVDAVLVINALTNDSGQAQAASSASSNGVAPRVDSVMVRRTFESSAEDPSGRGEADRHQNVLDQVFIVW